MGASVAVTVAAIVVYVPGLNNVVLGGGPVPALAILSPIGAGILLICYEFARRFLRRRGSRHTTSVRPPNPNPIGWFGGIPKTNRNLMELVRTTSSVK